MSKTFIQAQNDLAVLANDPLLAVSGASNATAQILLNMGVKYIMAMADWNFNKTSTDITSVASQQAYAIPYNVARVDKVFVYANSLWYAPEEIKSEEQWRKMNYTTSVYSDVAQYWHYSLVDGKVEIFPTPANAGSTIRVLYTKKIRDLSQTAGYATGTISTTAGSGAVVGVGTTFTARMAGQGLKITSATTPIGDYWLEIVSFTDTTNISVKPTIPTTLAGASYTINEMLPFPDGFEDLATWFALDSYYQSREMTAISNRYSSMWRDALGELKARDQRTTGGILKQEPTSGIVNPNYNPWSIEIT